MGASFGGMMALRWFKQRWGFILPLGALGLVSLDHVVGNYLAIRDGTRSGTGVVRGMLIRTENDIGVALAMVLLLAVVGFVGLEVVLLRRTSSSTDPQLPTLGREHLSAALGAPTIADKVLLIYACVQYQRHLNAACYAAWATDGVTADIAATRRLDGWGRAAGIVRCRLMIVQSTHTECSGESMRRTHRPAARRSSRGRSPAGAHTQLLRPLIAAVLAASAVGCGNAAELVADLGVDETGEHDSDGDASADRDGNAGQRTYDVGEDITVTEGTGIPLPPEIVAALDVPAGFTVAAVVRHDEADGGDGSIAVAGTFQGASVEDLTARLESALVAAGWQVRDLPDLGNAYAVVGIADRRPESLGYNITSSPDVPVEGPYQLALTLFPNGL